MLSRIHSKGVSFKMRVKLPFLSKYYTQVSNFVNTTKYLVFNWRSETKSWAVVKEFVPPLVHIARNWSNKYKGYKIILVSDISFSHEQLWHGMKDGAPLWVIQMLQKTFQKLETLPARTAFLKNNPVYSDLLF